MLERSSIIILMNRLNNKTRSQVIRCLVEGNSIRATERITGVTKKAITRLLQDVGEVCRGYQDKHLRGLACKRLQIDEIWSFCYAKARNVPADKQGVFGYGDVWTWTAIDADSKLCVSWLIGKRDAECAAELVQDVSERLNNRVQITTDNLRSYLIAIEDTFGSEVDYAILQKIYAKGHVDTATSRYSPPQCIGIKVDMVIGSPDPDHISTSYVERQNLTMRMQMRRFTRLTNGFSKKVENLGHAVALHFMYYNFCRVHQTLRVTPAMAAGVETRVWDIEDIVDLLTRQEKVQTAKEMSA